MNYWFQNSPPPYFLIVEYFPNLPNSLPVYLGIIDLNFCAIDSNEVFFSLLVAVFLNRTGCQNDCQKKRG